MTTTTASPQAARAGARAARPKTESQLPPPVANFDSIWRQLEALGSDSVRRSNTKAGVGPNQFGVMMGKLRALAAQLQADPASAHPLALRLWETGNADAMVLAAMLLNPTRLDESQLEAMVRPLTYTRLLDELVHNVVAPSPHAATLRRRWMASPQEYLGRAGWQLAIAAITDPKTVKAARRSADGLPTLDPDLDLDHLLERIEAEVIPAPLHKQESITHCLVMIATHYDTYTQRCIALGEKLGRYDTRPVPKGCTAWYAPEWIAAILNRRK
jgi:hypothetical protein